LATKSGGFEPYRYVCVRCGEEVYIAAAHSEHVVPYFKHRNGNNNVECENYMGQYGEANANSHLRERNREEVELYFQLDTRTFCLGLRYSEDEINVYEESNAIFEIRESPTEKAFVSLPIDTMYFMPDAPTWIPIDRFSFSYYLSNTVDKTKHSPMFFRVQGQDGDKAKFVRSSVLYTNVQYCAVFPHSFIYRWDNPDLVIKAAFSFKTMGKQFVGVSLIIKRKTALLDAILSSWGYELESSEMLTLLWPPATLKNDVSIVDSDYAFLYSSFELLAHGNTNLDPGDINKVTNNVSRILVKPKAKIIRKNTEITIDKGKQFSHCFKELSITVITANTFTVSDDSTYFLFNSYGVRKLSKDQTVPLTPQSMIRRYSHGYLTGCVYPVIQKELTGKGLLIDILLHYRNTKVFDNDDFHSCALSKIASHYIDKCKVEGFINTAVQRLIKEGRL